MNEKEKEELLWRTIMDEMDATEFQERVTLKLGYRDQYTESRINAPTCCPSCLQAVQISYTQCPKCGFKLDITMVETLRDNAFDLVAYAWNYRRRYEEDIAKGKIYKGKVTTQYCLAPPEDWLVYLASIMFAAILGGLSYDAFKKLLSTISSSFQKRFHKKIPREQWQEEFYRKLTEYFLGIRNPDSPIFRAYIEGLIRSKELTAVIENSPDFDDRLAELLKTTKNLAESGASEMSIPDFIPKHESQPKVDKEKIMKELHERIYEQESRINQLRHYLEEINNVKEEDKEEQT